MSHLVRKSRHHICHASLEFQCPLGFAVGASASYFDFVATVALVLCLYPLIALGDPHAWRKVYGELAKGSVTRHRLSLTWICCIGSRSGEEQELHSPLLY